MSVRGERWDVPLADVRLPPDAIEAALAVLASGWLSGGAAVERFERAFAGYVGCRHAVACSSGTAALQLALESLGVGPGDEVIVPAITFVATANAVALTGAKPVFADVIGEDDLTMEPASAASLISTRTKAVVAVHYGGHPCSAEIAGLARREGIALVEDAAHALGASGAPGPCGAWGEAGCFSFFANKALPLGEGGMLTTNDDGVAASARLLRSHGMTSGTWDRHTGRAADYDVVAPGHNFRIDEMRAGMGVALLPRIDDEIDERAAHVARYRNRLAHVDGVDVPFAGRSPQERSAHHLATVLLARGVDRDAVAGSMRDAGVQTSVHYRPLHQLTAYRDPSVQLEVADGLAPRLLTLPLFPHLQDEQHRHVTDSLEQALAVERAGTVAAS